MDDTALDAPEKGVRRWRLAGWIAAGLLVVLLGLVLIAPGLIDWNAYKDRFETMMSTALGRQVVIAGDLSFRTLPTPALRAADVRIGNVPDGRADYLAKAERLDAVVALFPLLRGDIRIRRIELIAPEIALERTADGRGNWQLGGEAPKEPDISETDSAMAAISVDDFVVRKGTLSFYDAQSMQEFKASAIELRLVAESLSGPFQGQARMQVADVPLDLSIKASRFERAARVPVSVTMTVRDAKATLSGWFRLQDADAHMPQMALAAGIDVPDLAVLLGDMGAMASHPLPVIAGLDQPFSLEGDLSVDGDIRLSDLRGKFAATTLSGALEYIMEDDPALTATVRADQIDLDPFFAKDAVDAVAAEGASTFPEKTVNWPDVPKDLALTLSLAVDAAHYRGGMISRATMDLHSEDGVLVIEQARANLPGASSLSLNGQLSQKGENPQLAGTLKASSSNVRAVLDWLEIALPIPRDRLSSLVFESAVKATPNDIAFDDLSLVLDASHVEGTVLMVFGPDQPALEADIRVDRLALDDYFLPPAPDAPPFDRVDLSRRANDMLVDSESLDLRLKLALGRLSAFGQDLRDVQLVLDRHLDALTVERAAFKNQEGADFGFSGRVQAGDDIPGIDMLVRGSLPDLARAVDALAVTSPPFLRPVGSVTFEGRIAGALTDVEVDLGGQLAGGRLTARGKAGSALDPKAGTLDLDLTVDHPSHRALAARFGFDALAHGDALPVHLEAQLSGPAMGLDVAGKGRLLGGQMDVTGQMAGHDGGQNLELDITATHPELAQLVRQVIPDYRPRKAELGPLSGHLSVAYDASSHRLGLKIAPSEVGPSRVSGTLDVKLAKDRPFLTVELDLGAVPLPDFLPPASTGIMPARKTGTRRWSQEPLALEGLRGFDGTLALAAQMMTLDPWSWMRRWWKPDWTKGC
ncbi:AsmA family protein [Iodidimonas gelatinilytica]|nr:AsmA family protein [Iodidimonas gelatinilytica]